MKSPKVPTPAIEKPETATPRPDADKSEEICWHCDKTGLHPDLLAALLTVAAQYHARTGKPIVINSGRRTLQHQARLMAEMTQAQLEGMYCRHGYPSYIRDIVAARKKNGALSSEQTYDILRRRTEGFISSHLYGAAVDISPDGADVELLRSMLTQHGFAVLDERSLGVQCLHATFRAVPRAIVRE